MICSVTLLNSCNPKNPPAGEEQKQEQPKDTTPVNPPVTEDTTLFACDPLCTPNPSKEAQKVYDFLRKCYKRKIISGAMACVSWNTNEAEWVNYHTGHYPALTCFDLIQATMTDDWAKKQYVSYEAYEQWWQNNGLIAGMWHHMVPKTQAASTASNNSTYKPNETAFVPANALKEGTWENKIYMQDLATAAQLLKGFKDRNIPVIWRPYHEAAGQWFWWGKSGDYATEVALWQFMWHYFVETCGLNNLIWVWTTQGSDQKWYPGDKYVDIIGRDIYNKTAPSFFNYYSYDESIYPNKMITLSEFGNASEMKDIWETGAAWSWFMPWYDSNRTKSASPSSVKFTDTATPHQHATIEWWKNAWTNDYVIDRAHMPNLK